MEAFPDTIQSACKVAVASGLFPHSRQDPEGQEQHQNGASYSQFKWMPAKQVKEAWGLFQLGEDSLEQAAMAPRKSC